MSDEKSTKTQKKLCKNCGREKVVRQHGMCGPCSRVSLAYPVGHPERNVKLAEIKERILAGGMSCFPAKKPKGKILVPGIDFGLSPIARAGLTEKSQKGTSVGALGCSIYPTHEELTEKRRAVAMELAATTDPRFTVLLNFENDADLLESIRTESKRNRRDIDKHILYLLDRMFCESAG